MITIQQLQKKYLRRIPKRFKVEIERYINEPEIQDLLRKGWQYKLTDTERNYIFSVGRHKDAKYPHLYWLLFIYMHPLTSLSVIATKIEKLGYPIFPEKWSQQNPYKPSPALAVLAIVGGLALIGYGIYDMIKNKE